MRNELDNIDYESQVHSREAKFEIYKPIIPSEHMRLIGKYSEDVGSTNAYIFISVSKNPYISVWTRYVEEKETDDDIFAFTNYNEINEFKTYNNYSKFITNSKWSPKNINYTDENITLDGDLYSDYVCMSVN